MPQIVQAIPPYMYTKKNYIHCKIILKVCININKYFQSYIKGRASHSQSSHSVWNFFLKAPLNGYIMHIVAAKGEEFTKKLHINFQLFRAKFHCILPSKNVTKYLKLVFEEL